MGGELSARPSAILTRRKYRLAYLTWALLGLILHHHSQRHPSALAVPLAGRHDASTLVVTNDGAYRNASQTAASYSRSPSTRDDATNRPGSRRAKQLKPVDVSQWFREDTRDYPDAEIERLLRRTPESVKELYNVLNTQLDPHLNLTERVAFYNDDEEHGSGVREESVCRSVTRNIYPREATHKNSLVYIPNDKDFMQVIQAEICQHPERECSYLTDALPYGMSSICYQKYAYKKLLYFDALDKRMASDLFRYPSCCACYIRTLPLDLRSSANATTSSPQSLRNTKPALVGNPPERAAAGLSTDQGESSADAPLGRTPDEKPEAPASSLRSSKQMKQSSQAVILNANKVFQSD